MKERGNKLLLVKSFENSTVKGYSENSRIEKYKLEDFFSKFAGNILVPYRPNKKSRRKNSIHIRKDINNLVLCLLLLSCFIYSAFFFQSFLVSLLFLLKLVGFGLSFFLLYSEFNPKNTFFTTTCDIFGGNCSEIIKNTYNSSFFVFSWAELGCTYFLTGSLLIIWGFPTPNDTFLFLLLLNIPAICFIPYSLYYQKHISKSWCYFCLTIMLIFVFELLTLSGLVTIKAVPDINSIMLFPVLSLLCFIFLQKIKFNLENEKLNKSLLFNLRYSKCNPEIINKIKSDLSFISMPDAVGLKIFGESDFPQKRIFIVLSAFCPPCKKAYYKLDKLMLDSRKEDIEVNIVFSVDPIKEKGSKSYKVCQEIASYFLQTTGEKDQFKEILKHWFVKEKPISDYPDICKSYSEAILEEVAQILSNQRKWVKSNNINYTPAIILDGYLLPKGYSMEDIEFML